MAGQGGSPVQKRAATAQARCRRSYWPAPAAARSGRPRHTGEAEVAQWECRTRPGSRRWSPTSVSPAPSWAGGGSSAGSRVRSANDSHARCCFAQVLQQSYRSDHGRHEVSSADWQQPRLCVTVAAEDRSSTHGAGRRYGRAQHDEVNQHKIARRCDHDRATVSRAVSALCSYRR